MNPKTPQVGRHLDFLTLAWDAIREVINQVRKILRQGVTIRLEELGFQQTIVDDELHLQYATRTVDWIVLACFASRIVVAPLFLFVAMTELRSIFSSYAIAALVLMAWNFFLMFSVTRPRLRLFLNSNQFFAVDLALTALADLWAAAIMYRGQVLLANHDTFWSYTMATVATWTVLKGVRTGLLLLPVSGCVLYGMAFLNHATPSGPGLEAMIYRFCWLASAVPIPAIILKLARQGAGLGSTKGHRAGRALERIRSLRMIHDTVLQTLAQIVQRAVAAELPVRERARQIRQLAVQQRDDLDQALRADDRGAVGLIDGLQSLVRQFGAQGITVNLVASEVASEPPSVVTESLLGATREALTNVRKHAAIGNVTVHASTSGRGYRIAIRDHGRGFDPKANHSGAGTRESVRQRLVEVGGQAQIWSELGRGTRVELLVDFAAARRAAGRILAPEAAINVSSETATSVHALTEQALAWFAVAALAYRAIISPVQSVTLFTSLDPRRALLFMIAVVLVFTFDIGLLLALLFGKYPRLFRSPILLIIDLTLIAVINFWSAFLLPPGTLLEPMHEALWIYTLGTVALWTALRGPLTGAAIIAGGFPLQAVMAKANHIPLNAGSWMSITAQEAITFAAFAISWFLVALARRGAQEAVDEGIKTGLTIERAWALRDLYEEVLKTLSKIIDSASGVVSLQDVMDIRGTALDEVDRLRAAIDRDRPSTRTRFADELKQMTGSFQSRGLRVELVTSQLLSDPPRAVADRLLAASKEALSSIALYGGVVHAVLRASNIRDGFEIVIRDHGAGLPGQLAEGGNFIRRYMAEVNGDAEISTELGRGTKIRLRWHPTENSRPGTGINPAPELAAADHVSGASDIRQPRCRHQHRTQQYDDE